MTTQAANTADVVRLALGVARLGENDLRGWWQGHALDRTGRYVLSGMFRRTWRPAALELDIAAATLIHNDVLGRPTALHLFSALLPFRRWATSWLAEQKTAPDPDPLLDTLEGWTAQTSSDGLSAWIGEAELPEAEPLGEGLLLGRLNAIELADPALIPWVARALAASYLDQTGQLRPPYFDLAR
jgi:hypothetical protein